MVTKRENIKSFVEHISGDIGDICAEFYYKFLEKETQNLSDSFRNFLELWNELESDETIEAKKYFDSEEYAAAFSKVRPLAIQLIENLVKENKTEKEFYESLWVNISNKAFFPTDIERICAILFMLVAPQIPYFHLPEPISMEDEEYRKLCDATRIEYKKALFATRCGYEQHTEVASQLIAIYEGIHGEKEKLVYVARLLSYYDMRIQKFREKLEECEEENSEEE